MSRREFPYAYEDMENRRANVNPRQHPSLTRRWSESDDEYFARVHEDYPRPAESRQDGVNQAATRMQGYTPDDFGVPRYAPPPYSERDHDFGRAEFLRSQHLNLNPEEGRGGNYVTDSSGRRERYIMDSRGVRVAWPFQDHVDSSADDEDSDMVHLESGRFIPRREWEGDREWEYSSEEPSDDTDEEFYQRRRLPMRQRNAQRQRDDREVARIRGGYSAGARRSGRRSHAGYGGQSYHMVGDRNRRSGQYSSHH